MRTSTARFALRGCAARIAANRNESPAPAGSALAKLFIQPKRDWQRPGAPRTGWKRGELFEVLAAVLSGDWQAAAEELGDCSYYLAQSPLWFVLVLFPRRVLDAAVWKMTARAFGRQEEVV
jgi:hypothetical protein